MAFIILTTVSKMADAERIAGIMVEEKLAACVNIMESIRSVYRWKGRIVRENEIMLIIKTSRERYKHAMFRIAEIHPYELPETLALEISEGSSKYLKWLEDSTAVP
ncbi:MAG: divalent-cation tolerance protein CutA [Thermoplasmataceae archaeon]